MKTFILGLLTVVSLGAFGSEDTPDYCQYSWNADSPACQNN